MEFTISVPKRIATGKPLRTPLVITLTVPREDANRCDHLPNLVGLWIYISLMSADGTLCLAPPHEDLLRGRRVDSIHTHPQKDTNRRALGCASFPYLSITESGTYRFRINIVDMARDGLSDSEGAGNIFPALYSNAFDVVDLKEMEEQDLVVNEVHLDLEGIGVGMESTVS